MRTEDRLPSSLTKAWLYSRKATVDTGRQAERALLASTLDLNSYESTEKESPKLPARLSTVTLGSGYQLNVLEILPPIPPSAPEVRHSGKALLLLHGFGGGLAFWYKNLASLSKYAGERRVFAIDWLGMGFSSRVPVPLTAKVREMRASEVERFFSDSLEEFRVSQGVEQFHFIAHSLGGYFATLYSLRYPERVSHLTLVSGAGFGNALRPEAKENSSLPVKRLFPFQNILRAAKAPALQRDKNDTGLIYGFLHFLWQFNITPLHVVRKLGGTVATLAVTKFVKDKFTKSTCADLMPAIFDYAYALTMALPPGSENCLPDIIQAGGVPHYSLVPKLLRAFPSSTSEYFGMDFIRGEDDWIGAPPEGLHVGRKPIAIHTIEAAGHQSYVENSDKFNAIMQRIIDAVK